MADEFAQVAEDSARSGFFLISGTALATVVLAIGSILMARVLDDELYGQYSLALVVPQILFVFSDLGLSQGITKFTAELRSKGEIGQVAKIIQHGLILRATIGIIIFLINFAFAEFLASFILHRPELAFYVRLASLSVLFQVIIITASSAFIGMDKAHYAALTDNVNAIAKTVIQLTLVLLGFAVGGAVAGQVASQAIAGVIGIILLLLMLRKWGGVSNGQTFTQNVKVLLRYGAPLSVSAFLVGFSPLYQNVILAAFTTDAAVGNFRAATNFVVLLTVISIPISSTMLPAFSKLNSKTRERMAAFFKLANKYTAILIVPVAILIMILSREVIQIVYGPTYESAPLFLALSCSTYFLVGVGFLTLASFYNGMGETRITMRINLITFSLLFAIAPILTSFYGVVGLIVSSLLASSVGQIYSSYYARKRFKAEFDTSALLKVFAISALSSIIPITIVNFAGLPMFLGVILGGLLYLLSYVTLVPLTKVVNHTELTQVSLVLQRIRFLAFIVKPVLKYQEKILRARSGGET